MPSDSFPLKNVALIPARSGSKRLSDKNIKLLAGHPLLAYTVAAARASGLFSKVVVSTDSEHYAEIARHYGAEVPFLRPAQMAGEHSPDIEWVEWALSELLKRGESYGIFSILRPTSPFRQAQTIRRAYREFIAERGVDSIRAVEKCREHPGKMWLVRERRMTPFLPQKAGEIPTHSRQTASLAEVYVQNASLEMAYTRVVFEDHSIAGGVVMPFLTEGFEGFDINDAHDFWCAQRLVEEKKAELPPVSQTPFTATILRA